MRALLIGVIGTHTHEPTLPLYLLPGGTAHGTDVGMTGPSDGIEAGRTIAISRVT